MGSTCSVRCCQRAVFTEKASQFCIEPQVTDCMMNVNIAILQFSTQIYLIYHFFFWLHKFSPRSKKANLLLSESWVSKAPTTTYCHEIHWNDEKWVNKKNRNVKLSLFETRHKCNDERNSTILSKSTKQWHFFCKIFKKFFTLTSIFGNEKSSTGRKWEGKSSICRWRAVCMEKTQSFLHWIPNYCTYDEYLIDYIMHTHFSRPIEPNLLEVS